MEQAISLHLVLFYLPNYQQLMYFTYIIFSPKLHKFYIGSTELHPPERLKLHNDKFYGNEKFTTAGIPWQLFWFLECPSKKTAICIEKHIKRMKSKKYIHNLTKYPSMAEKLLHKYH